MRYQPVIAASAAVMLVACSGFPRNQPGDGFGYITISSPRIEGRERLINERREQEAWLRKQLEKVDEAVYGVSGEVDLRSMSLIAAQIGVNRDPAIRLDEVNRQRQLEMLRQAADDERALGTFRASARDQVLADYKDKKITAEEASEALKKLGYDMSVPRPSSAASAPASSVQSGRPTSYLTLAEVKDKSLTPDGSPRRTSISSTPIEAFQDRLAAREVIRNELNDVRLDDLHDLDGRTLYRLTFNAEVIPDDDASAWAFVRLRAKMAFDEKKAASLLPRARQLLERQLESRKHAVQREMLVRLRETCWNKEVGDDAARLLASDANVQGSAFRRAIRCTYSEFGSRTRASLERALMKEISQPAGLAGRSVLPADPAASIASPPDVLLAEILLDGQRPAESSDQFKQRVALQRQWAVWLGEVVGRYQQELWADSALACIYSPVAAAGCDLTGNGPEERFSTLLRTKATGSVYSVTPKETVQRLSEVGSNRKMSEFLLNVSAVSSVAGIGAAMQNIQAYDAFYSALRRQPLVVGVTESGSTCQDAATKNCAEELIFGWVLGPSFQMSNDGKSVRFRHNVVQRLVAAELVLPAWLDQVELEPEVFWVRESGEVKPAEHCRPKDNKPCAAKKMVVQLPTRPLAALDAVNVRDLREPRVDAYQYLDVVVGEKASVLITGQHLWRSTEVLLGGQRADLITILPDSSGIVATFEKVQAPFGADKSRGPRRASDDGDRAAHIYLTVVTSEGQVEAGRVAVRSSDDSGPAQKPLEALGAVPRVVAGVEHSFELNQALKPTDSALVRVGSGQDVALRALLDKTTQLDEQRKKVRYALAATSAPNLKTGSPVNVDLLVTRSNGAVDVLRVVSAGSYYEKEADTEVTATLTRAKQDQPIKLHLKLPIGSVAGFGAIAKGAARVTVTLKAAAFAEKPIELQVDCPILPKAAKGSKAPASLEPDSCDAELPMDESQKRQLAAVKNMDISTQLALVGQDVPKLKPGAVPITP